MKRVSQFRTIVLKPGPWVGITSSSASIYWLFELISLLSLPATKRSKNYIEHSEVTERLRLLDLFLITAYLLMQMKEISKHVFWSGLSSLLVWMGMTFCFKHSSVCKNILSGHTSTESEVSHVFFPLLLTAWAWIFFVGSLPMLDDCMATVFSLSKGFLMFLSVARLYSNRKLFITKCLHVQTARVEPFDTATYELSHQGV